MSVAREYKWREFISNPITPRESQVIRELPTQNERGKSMNKTTDFTFLFDGDSRPVRFTNTFKSSVIPGQERDISNTPILKDVKMYVQDQINWQKSKEQEEKISKAKERAKSAAPTKVESKSTPQKSKSFVDFLNTGEQKTRKIATYLSSVLPLDSNGLAEKVPMTARNNKDRENKWKMDKNEIIPEKNAKNKMNNELWRNYFGVKDTPLQRYLREHHGSAISNNQNTNNAKKQTDIIPSNVGWNQHSQKKDVYKDKDAKDRRANEFDSCIWPENLSNYKSFNGGDISAPKKNLVASTTGFLNKNSGLIPDNNLRAMDAHDIKQKNLKSEVLPLKEYPSANRKDRLKEDQDIEHELEQLKEFALKMKKPKSRTNFATNNNFYDSRAERLSNGSETKRMNIIQILNNNQPQKEEVVG